MLDFSHILQHAAQHFALEAIHYGVKETNKRNLLLENLNTSTFKHNTTDAIRKPTISFIADLNGGVFVTDCYTKWKKSGVPYD